MEQQPDKAPGPYYVSVVKRERPNDPRLLSGPYSTHAAALAAVDEANRIACDMDPRGHFYAYGTVRMACDFTKPGILNELGKMQVAS